LVVDDGSSDDTVAVAEAFGDHRLRIVRHERNMGIPATRNTGLHEARGRFIAWLDSDDTARPTRLREQVEYLEAHPLVAMVGCCAGKIGRDGTSKRGIRVPPLACADIGAWLLFRSAFQQSSITGRAEVLKRFAYDRDYPVCEDLDMFQRLAENHAIENMPRVLIDRRMHPDQTIRMEQDAIRDRKARLFSNRLGKLGVTFSEEDLRRHVLLGNPKGFSPDAEFLDWAQAWLDGMHQANRRTGYVDEEGLKLTTAYFWGLACSAAAGPLGRGKALRTFWRSSLASGLLSAHGRRWLRCAAPLFARGAVR
ncbi:MAG TPA: glycosyltransferase family A protein, partial [Allosphingosinicella sp.]